MEKGIQTNIQETALKMLQKNMDTALIESITGLPQNKILNLKKNL